MSDLFGNHIVGFPTRRLICVKYLSDNNFPTIGKIRGKLFPDRNLITTNEPSRGKTNNVVSKQV